MSKQVELRLTFFIDLPDDVTIIEVDASESVSISYGQHGTTYGTFMDCISRVVEVDDQSLDEYNAQVGQNCGNCGRKLSRYNFVEVEGRGNYCENCAERYQPQTI